MTTMVVISSPKPNHQRVHVRMKSADKAVTYHEVVLDDGQSTVQYVHGGQVIEIEEISKDVPAAG